ncbi:hypothetical protein [Streptomyces sp. NL15-2K]|uniref:hypothetical protein n=1 Tax=Streptomyces sp. NL15-2K TaxID=376149 RepID=UPI000F569C22|nr:MULTISPECIES: hypothetical protein [Actinomycetes]WKX06824.1 hypothetical protein Q4V64_04655 [Kutzneria buriramensis]GCB43833.1 hypothetical protein SNL152K_1118 [Streptomyces sp. NL15-2K]
MGTHRRPKPPSRTRIATLGMAVGAVSLLPTQSGNGKAIHAPRTGKNVEIVPLDSMPFFAASRP